MRRGLKCLCRLFCAVLALSLQTAPVSASPVAPTGEAVPVLRLRVTDAGGQTRILLPLGNGSTFAIRYIHSVARTPVEDWFAVNDNCLYLEKTVYQDFGAGLPHMPEGGQRMTTAGGHVIISGFHRALPRFDLRVGRIARHTLILPDAGGWREVPLDRVAPPGSALTFRMDDGR
ncbi:MAG TPA: DUF1850 domain-containing protein [Candidatus Desulfovibrio intestinavium]|uniref:DUF1850 domain-containing protein n=1 Tax=Candidatus Desulfovibrio intestinavium TaxID=2838534 RepID=A0A9D2HMN9_9BACT|nr:DUF1850 domain-containing protein [Candidatus Desulfovibrio intestinavium]